VQVALAVDVVVHARGGVHVPGAVGVLDESGRDAEGGSGAVAFGIERCHFCAQAICARLWVMLMREANKGDQEAQAFKNHTHRALAAVAAAGASRHAARVLNQRTCDCLLRHIPGVHGQALVRLLAAEHHVHAVFGLGVAHLHQPAVDLNSEAALEHGGGSVNGEEVDKAEAAAEVAATLAHDAHLLDAGAVPRKNRHNCVLVGVHVQTLRALLSGAGAKSNRRGGQNETKTRAKMKTATEHNEAAKTP